MVVLKVEANGIAVIRATVLENGWLKVANDCRRRFDSSQVVRRYMHG